MFTDLNADKINEISKKEINLQKIELANETTAMLHGKDAALEVEEIAKHSFSENSSGAYLPNLKINKSNIDKDLINLISNVEKKLSKSEIRRLIKSSGIKINNETVTDEKFIITSELMREKNFIKLSVGKKRHYKIVI
tara:strand:- start:380 stop:793 length:414 start_codon:yes stop_codon:yes gene_type:complete